MSKARWTTWLVMAACAVATADPADPAIGYKVRLRWTVLQPTDPTSKLAKLIERNNRKEKRSEIDDSINAELIDPAKVSAFLAAVRKLPASTQQQLAKGTILLDSPGLFLGVASPATPGNFASLSGFSKLAVDGAYLDLEPTLAIDVARARRQVAASRKRITELDAQIASIEKSGDAKLGELMRTRFQVSWVWRTNAEALARASGKRADVTDLEAAKREIATYVVNMGSMPDEEDMAPL